MASKLPRLPRGTPLMDKDGGPSIDLQRRWQTLAEAVEALEARIEALEP